MVNYFLLCYFFVMPNYRNDLLWMKVDDNVTQSLLCECISASYMEIDSQSNDIHATTIYGWREDIWIEWLTCRKLLLTAFIYFSYYIYNILPLFPEILIYIRFVGFGLLDIFRYSLLFLELTLVSQKGKNYCTYLFELESLLSLSYSLRPMYN